MKYIVTNPNTCEYLVDGQNPRWSIDINEASKYNTMNAAHNVINSTYNKWLGPLVSQVRVMQFDAAVGVTPIMTWEEAEEKYLALEKAARDFAQAAKEISSLVTFYTAQEARLNGMQQDLLHDIELNDGFVGIKALRFTRDLRKLRQDRRKAKDRKELTQKIKEKGGIDLGIGLRSYFNQLETRQYSPRVLIDLFKKD